MTRAIIVLIFWLASGGFGAYAQSDVKVIGPVTPGNCVQWFSTTQVQDPALLQQWRSRIIAGRFQWPGAVQQFRYIWWTD